MTYNVEILASDRHTNVAGLNQSMESHPSPSLVIGSLMPIHK
jgi:hypothetical protein